MLVNQSAHQVKDADKHRRSYFVELNASIRREQHFIVTQLLLHSNGLPWTG